MLFNIPVKNKEFLHTYLNIIRGENVVTEPDRSLRMTEPSIDRSGKKDNT
jgi:hypothetical protein